ncbi:YgdI/YgdR family lipoprotein [Bordetella genomosp. 13]|uniref:YgdI/YgdR family lipoprotein n=1 Tax=Bordetella genomosp. 13 TaxID=463040 RepID=A0A1W6ZE49_9BORD|nr:YgdI/YgdR family lipoprotein [Bordetella genomosp. 13]ARP95599.1 YgdI/YgdR family lipoprotein [Bordetella genomosp. 13]
MSPKNLMMVIAATSLTALAGCSTPTTIHKADGTQVHTADRPDYDEDSGFYKYEKGDREIRVNKDDVKSIEDVDD